MLSRRTLLSGAALLGAGIFGVRWFADQGIRNRCLTSALPESLANHPLVREVWQGLDPGEFWDCHVHLVGVGDTDSGAWTNPDMQKLSHPWKLLQRKFYFNASCVEEAMDDIDIQYVTRLRSQLAAMAPPGGRQPKLMLMAFDWHRDERGQPVKERSTFMMPHAWVRRVVDRYPDDFEWIASIHPYRDDAVEALRQAYAEGARAVKWLPAAQGMDPASPRCDDFYDAAAELGLPLIVHGGEEQAVDGAEYQELCNPLRLRRGLERGATMIVAHLASLGNSIDLDKGASGPAVPAIELLERMMGEEAWQGRLYSDLSAVTQRNRLKVAIPMMLKHPQWANRLLHATDYPLPGVMALFSLRWLTREGYLTPDQAEVITEVHSHNALLFDFMVKRLVSYRGNRLSPEVFQTRSVFDRSK